MQLLQTAVDDYGDDVMEYIVNNFETTHELFLRFLQANIPDVYLLAHWPLTLDQFQLLKKAYLDNPIHLDYLHDYVICKNTHISMELLRHLREDGYCINYKYYTPEYSTHRYYHNKFGILSIANAKALYENTIRYGEIQAEFLYRPTPVLTPDESLARHLGFVFRPFDKQANKKWQILYAGLDELDELRKERAAATVFAMISLAFCEDADYLALADSK